MGRFICRGDKKLLQGARQMRLSVARKFGRKFGRKFKKLFRLRICALSVTVSVAVSVARKFGRKFGRKFKKLFKT